MPRAGRNLHEYTRLNDVFMLVSFYFRSMNSNLYNLIMITQWVIHRNALKVLDDPMHDINQTSSHWAPRRAARILLRQSPTYGSSFSSAHRWCSGNPAIAREAHWPQLGGHKGTAWLRSCLVGHLAALCVCNCVTVFFLCVFFSFFFRMHTHMYFLCATIAGKFSNTSLSCQNKISCVVHWVVSTLFKRVLLIYRFD